jgi:hypothetical protein
MGSSMFAKRTFAYDKCKRHERDAPAGKRKCGEAGHRDGRKIERCCNRHDRSIARFPWLLMW